MGTGKENRNTKQKLNEIKVLAVPHQTQTMLCV